MKSNLTKAIFPFLLLITLFGVCSFQFPTALQQVGFASLTPTIDPLSEPPLPSNPTELELGQNRYWHWCMTCHGDRGQGLTDEFRRIWPEDHQNCWARGCHTGRPDDLGFPIPTVVPAIVDGTHLSRFPSLQEFADYLQSTHPPQSPGILTVEEYHAIALFVFTMNGRLIDSATPTVMPILTPTETLIPVIKTTAGSNFTLAIVSAALTAFAVVIFIFLGRANRIQQKGPSIRGD